MDWHTLRHCRGGLGLRPHRRSRGWWREEGCSFWRPWCSALGSWGLAHIDDIMIYGSDGECRSVGDGWRPAGCGLHHAAEPKQKAMPWLRRK